MADERQESRSQRKTETVSRIINVVLAAGVIGLGSMVITNNTEIAGMHAQMESYDMRISMIRIEISDRYRRSDADRDHKEVKADLRRESDTIRNWVQSVNGRLRQTEIEARLLSHFEKDIEKLDDRLRKLEKNPPASLQADLQEFKETVQGT